MMIRWLVLMALLAGCATQQVAQADCKNEVDGPTSRPLGHREALRPRPQWSL